MATLACASPRWSCFAAAPASQRRRLRHVVAVRAGEGGPPESSNSRPPPQQQAGPPPPAAPIPSLADPAGMVVYGGRLPPTRRLLVSGLSATSIILAGNLFGVTSWLLSLDGGTLAASSRLDVLVPINGSKRCFDADNGFTFLYPAKWLADQTLYRRAAERIERQASLDPPSLARERARARAGAAVPMAAFGPPGSTGEENISVVVAPIRDGFTLQKMGSPQEAATRFLETTVAPPGSGKTAVLLGAGSRMADGELYYWQEFTVESEQPRFFRHNVAAYAARNGLLYTINCQCAEPRWRDNAAAFRKAADSFTILNSGAGTSGFPDRL